MPNYKSMYFRLFSQISEAISLLQAAQQQGEEAFMADGDSANYLRTDEQSDSGDCQSNA